MRAKLLPTLCNPRDGSPPGSSFHEILQTRILECVVMPPFRESSPPREWTWISWGSCIAGGFFTTEPPGDRQFDKWGRIKNPEREAYAIISTLFMKQLVLWLQIEIMDYVINKLIMLQVNKFKRTPAEIWTLDLLGCDSYILNQTGLFRWYSSRQERCHMNCKC